jgi:hypothetical protein
LNKLEVLRQAVIELGDAPAPELARYIERKFGVLIPPTHIPIFRATLKVRGEPSRARLGEGDAAEKAAPAPAVTSGVKVFTRTPWLRLPRPRRALHFRQETRGVSS